MAGKKPALQAKFQEYVRKASAVRPKSFFSLGPLGLNLAIGHPKGVLGGRIVQIIGDQSSGKSTLALSIIRAHLAEYPEATALYVDFERSFDAQYAAACGVDLERVYLVEADTTEGGLDIIEAMVKEQGIKLVIIDSIAASVPSIEYEKNYTDPSKVANVSGLITRFCMRMIPILDNNDALLVVLNQLRMNFNRMSPETKIPFGGLALQYATAVTISLASIERAEDEQTIRAFIKKNKVGAPQQKVDFVIRYGRGIDLASDLLGLAIRFQVLEKRGAWYSYVSPVTGEIHKAQGLANAAESLPLDEIEQRVRAFLIHVEGVESVEKVELTDDLS